MNNQEIRTLDYPKAKLSIAENSVFANSVIDLKATLNEIQTNNIQQTNPKKIHSVVHAAFIGFNHNFDKKDVKNNIHHERSRCNDSASCFRIKYSRDGHRMDECNLFHNHMANATKGFKKNDSDAFIHLLHQSIRKNPVCLPIIEKAIATYVNEMKSGKTLKFRIEIVPELSIEIAFIEDTNPRKRQRIEKDHSNASTSTMN